MKSYLEIFRYTIKYKLATMMVVLCNVFFVVFNLLSLVLFIPVLQLIFKDPKSIELVPKPEFHWGIPDVFLYVKDFYNSFQRALLTTRWWAVGGGAQRTVDVNELRSNQSSVSSVYAPIWEGMHPV